LQHNFAGGGFVATSLSKEPVTAALASGAEALPRAELRIVELLSVLTTVVLADFTIYRGQGYTGLAAFFLGAIILLAIGKRPRQLRWPLWLIAGMLLLLAARLVWCGSPLQVASGLVLVVAFATALDGQTPFTISVLTMGSQAIAAGIPALAETLARGTPTRIHRSWILNVILPAAAFLVFSGLFVLANPDAVRFVARQLEAFFNWLGEWFVRMPLRPEEAAFWLIVALLAAGLLRPILRLDAFLPITATLVDARPTQSSLYAAFRNTLAAVIGLFAIYLTYEFYTLWKRDFPEGFYYAGYAHVGAAWLTVALALATLMLSVIFSGRILDDPRLPALRRLAWIWSLENLLLSLAVYNRLFIYIDFNGMTWMRIVGLFGISLAVAGFLLVVCKIVWKKDFPWLIHRQMWALAVAIYLFALVPVDGIAASYNVRRILAGDLSASMQIGVHPLDLEGVLALPPLLDIQTEEIREGVAALIADRQEQLQRDHERRQHAGWTAYQRSDAVALAKFESVRSKWRAFEDAGKREAAIKRLHDFAYRWY
jgi:hypothetical protein